MLVLRLALTLSLLLLSGFATATLLVPAASRLLRWGWALGLGSGWLTLGLAAAALIGIRSPLVLLIPLLPIALWAARWYAHQVGGENPLPPPKLFDLPLAGFLIVVLVPAFALAVTSPLPGWDGVAIWGFKGRIFYLEDRIPLEYFHSPITGYSHPEYPLHLPILLASLAKGLGRWEDPLLLALFSVWYGSLLLLLYGTLRGQGSRWWALFTLVGIAPIPRLFAHISAGYADLPLATYLAGTLAGLAIWLSRGERGGLAIAAISGGLAAWTKNEGLILLLVCWAVAWGWAPRYRQPRGPLLAGLGLALTIALPWHLFRLIQGIPVEPFAVQGWSQLQRLPIILKAMGREMAALGEWGALWAVALAVALGWPWLSQRAMNSLGGFFAAVLFAGLAAYVGIYVITPRDLAWHLATSLDRLLLHLLPAAGLTVGAGIQALLEESDHKNASDL